MLKLVLYTRRECGLCREMADALEQIRHDQPFELVDIDIDSSFELIRRYGSLVPVLEAEGVELSRYRLDRAKLDAYLSQTR